MRTETHAKSGSATKQSKHRQRRTGCRAGGPPRLGDRPSLPIQTWDDDAVNLATPRKPSLPQPSDSEARTAPVASRQANGAKPCEPLHVASQRRSVPP